MRALQGEQGIFLTSGDRKIYTGATDIVPKTAGGKVLIDLTDDAVTEDKVLSGVIFHDKKGDTLEGSCSFDSDTSDNTAAAAGILAGKTAHGLYSASATMDQTLGNGDCFLITFNEGCAPAFWKTVMDETEKQIKDYAEENVRKNCPECRGVWTAYKKGFEQKQRGG